MFIALQVFYSGFSFYLLFLLPLLCSRLLIFLFFLPCFVSLHSVLFLFLTYFKNAFPLTLFFFFSRLVSAFLIPLIQPLLMFSFRFFQNGPRSFRPWIRIRLQRKGMGMVKFKKKKQIREPRERSWTLGYFRSLRVMML